MLGRMNRHSLPRLAAVLGLAALPAFAQAVRANPAGLDWQPIRAQGLEFEIARTETTVGQFARFVAAMGRRTEAERRGGGQVYERGCEQRPGWVWRAPYGQPANDREPAAHITFDEAQAFCRWAGGRLPTDREWVLAAYTETRESPPAPFQRGRTYPYPTGDSPQAAQCLGDCPGAQARAVRHGAALSRGHGHALAGTTAAGVNGLHDMGANLWEWVDEPPGDAPEKRTRGGSWWYGAAQMRADHLQGKPPDTAVVYIGFRCVR